MLRIVDQPRRQAAWCQSTRGTVLLRPDRNCRNFFPMAVFITSLNLLHLIIAGNRDRGFFHRDQEAPVHAQTAFGRRTRGQGARPCKNLLMF